jgi:hypothetical protein
MTRHIGWNRATAALATAALAVLFAAGCSSGTGSVDKEEVARKISAGLEQEVGQKPDDVTCPENLPAEVGATIRCELTAGSDTLGVTVTTTSVEGGKASFDFKVDESVS